MKKSDFLIILLIFCVAVAVYFLTYTDGHEVTNKFAVIKINGKMVDRIELNDKNDGLEREYRSEFGYNKIEISNGRIRSKEADCPDQIDVKQGYISLVGETVVCLPNRFLIEIESEEAEEIDIINR